MPRTVYALMVGIDAYRSPVPPLNGCVNDIRSLEALLRERLRGSDLGFDPLLLLNKQARRQAVIDGFLKHLCKAGPDDVALFCYAGHGSQERTPPEFWHLEPDRLDETLVCVDSRDPGRYDLADKELAKLIAQVAKREPHILVILDSCHSGSGTRDISATGVRRVPTDARDRPLSTFLVTPTEAEALVAEGRTIKASSGWVKLPKGRHVVMSACHDNEEAKEVRIGDKVHGVFSHFLLETLRGATGAPTYRDLFKRVNALVRTKVAGQSPLIEATELQDLDRPFLGGGIVEQKPYYTVSYHQSDGWMIDAGAMHGIPPAAGDETTLLALFPVDAKSLDDLTAAVGEAAVVETMPTRSRLAIKLPSGAEPDGALTYKAVVSALPLPPLTVRIEGDAAGAKLVSDALAKAGAGGKASLLVREAREGAELRLTAGDGRFRIMRAADDRALFLDVDGMNAAAARQTVERLEHMARWTRIAMLANPATKLAPDSVRIEVYRIDAQGVMAKEPVDAATLASGLRFDYELRAGEWVSPQFKIKLVNTTGRRLFCMLLDLAETYMVSPALLPGGGIWLDQGEEAWALDGEPIDASIPDELWEQGLGEIKDLIKLIVSTEGSDATLLAQGELDIKFEPRGASRSAARASTLDRLMSRVQTRHIGAKPKPQDKLVDWTTSELSMTTARPLKSVPVPASGRTVAVAENVKVHGHPKLKATARLTSVSLAARSADVPPLPPLLVDDPSVVRPFEFSASRSGEPGLSVLELAVDAADAHDAVTPDEPLVVTIDAPLADGEHLLPVGHDGEFYLPLGRSRRVAGGVEVTLERLPKAISTRSLTSAVRILFEKIVTEILGREFRYPLLAAVDRAGKRTADPDAVRALVAKAQRVVVYVHGIIGDTIGMAKSAYTPAPKVLPPLPALAERYDLVLAFDYENLKTPIEQTARDLKGRLERVGLGAGHGKTLHIVAHSMGGLISRWFIEREGGNAMVQHLVMLGTPNGGSPWSIIEDWATTALALGLNGLTAVAWPAQLLGGLAAAVERVDVALDQMQPGSPFLESLAASSDPGVPYTILAGNTSIVRALDEQADAQKGRIARLLGKLSKQKLLHGATGLAFFGKPNDIAVSVASICAVPGGRARAATVKEVASDHISYFATEAGLRALTDALP